MIAGLLWRGWQWSGRGRTAAFHRGLADPRATQERLLRQLLRHHAASGFGQQHRFASCASPADFRSAVPLATWADVAPKVAAIRQGHQGGLSSERVTRLVPTSGSSAERKLIPWTAGLATGFARALAPWLDDVYRQHPAARGGPAYWCLSPPQDVTADVDGVAVGFATDRSYLGGAWQRLLARAMAVPDRILDAPDPLRATLLHLLRCADLRLISVWHPSFLDLLLDRLERDIADLRAQLAAGDPAIGLPPSPRRAAALAGCDPRRIAQCWPRLALVSAWADGPAQLPAAALRRRLGALPFQAKGLLATEGVVTIPCAGSHPLAITSHVFEFLDDDGRCHWAHELVPGADYEVVLTNGGGLWRYRLGDRVRVTGHLGRTPCLVFLGRSGTVGDLAGEKLDEGLAAAVLAAVVPDAAFAALQPEPEQRRWRLVLARDATVAPDLAARLDERLHRIEHWRIARHLGQLRAPVVVRSRHTAGELLVRLAARRGQRLGEVKPPVLLPAGLEPDADPVRAPDAGRATGSATA